MGHMPTATKSAQPQTFELAKEVVETPSKPKDQLELDLEVVPRSDLQFAPAEQEGKYTAVARQILTKNPDIAQRMMEQLMAQPGKPLRPEEFQTVAKPIEVQSQAELA